MADLDFDGAGPGLAKARARRLARVQRAQQMLVAAGLAALCVVGVAGALLVQVM